MLINFLDFINKTLLFAYNFSLNKLKFYFPQVFSVTQQSCGHAYILMFPSVRLSVCPSVRLSVSSRSQPLNYLETSSFRYLVAYMF
jgi:hypothetical protein